MKHEQSTRHHHEQTGELSHNDESLAALPDFQRAFAWHQDLCGISERVLQEYVAERQQALCQGQAVRKPYNR